jgi:hypothetical protein
MENRIVEVKEKKNGKWEITVGGQSTNKEYMNVHNALYYAVRIADKFGNNVVYLPGNSQHIINHGDII